jgi:hypothetical protein
LKALKEAALAPADDQSALTVAEFGAMFDLHRATAARHLEKLEAAGKAVKTRKRTLGLDGRRFYAVAYRLA